MKVKFIVFLILFPLVLLSVLPKLLWYTKDEVAMNLTIVDKTVAQQDYREHLALNWMLVHRKIINEYNQYYNISRDYTGYHPTKRQGDTPLKLHPNPDLIYVTDTYGVYEEDVNPVGNQRGERSTLLYGGLTFYDWNRIMESKTNKTTMILEFNSIASPTDRFTRRTVEKNMGFTWSGWIGRYFDDLANKGIPIWLIKAYEEQNQTTWNFEGHGMVFVNESDRVLVFDSKDVSGPVRFTFTPSGKSSYPKAWDSTYNYWFDIVTPHEGYDVQAMYTPPLSDRAKRTLQTYNIPVTFPAVLHQPDRNVYYFAGDYADVSIDYSKRFLLPNFFYYVFSVIYHQDNFFWRSYIPMMIEILASVSNEKESFDEKSSPL